MTYKSRRKSYEAKLEQVILNAIDRTTAAAVAPAKDETPVRTGTARGSIRYTPAVRTGNTFVGEFGSYNVDYFIWLEIGARGREGRHMLRRAADQTFPQFNNNLQAEYKAAFG